MKFLNSELNTLKKQVFIDMASLCLGFLQSAINPSNAAFFRLHLQVEKLQASVKNLWIVQINEGMGIR